MGLAVISRAAALSRTERVSTWSELKPLESSAWEKSLSGPELMERWLQRFGATPFDYQLDLEDASLTSMDPVPWHRMEVEGTGQLRG